MLYFFVLWGLLFPIGIVSQELKEITEQQATTENKFWKCSLGDQPGCQCFPLGSDSGFNLQCFPKKNYNFTEIYSVNEASLSCLEVTSPQCNETIQLTDSVYYSYLKGISTRSISKLELSYCRLPFRDLSIFLKVYLNLTYNLKLTIHSCASVTILSQDSFQTLSQLSNLNLQNNYLEYLPDNIFEKQLNLKKLSLENNNLKFINSNIFRNLNQLQLLHLGSNQIRVLDHVAFINLINLLELNLQNNLLETFPSKILQSMTKLLILDLSNNVLISLDEDTFQYNPKLQELFLQNNSFEVLPAGLFKQNNMLTKLSLKSNRKLSTIHRNVFDNLVNLQDLDLSDCKLNQSSLDSHTFRNLSRLSVLNLARNKLTKLDPNLFNGLTTLTSLELSSNLLTYIDPNTFNSLRYLNTLQLNLNRLIRLEGSVFKGLGALTSLFLQDNQLEIIKPEAMEELANLEFVNLARNRLKFDEDLKDYLLNDRRLSPLKYNLKLKLIDLSGNKIENFIDWFNMTSLTQLLLNNNLIASFKTSDLSQFSGNGNLTIDLRNNQIKHFLFPSPLEERTGNSEKKILLDGNPLVCDCYTYQMAQYINRTLGGVNPYSWTIEIPTLTCQEPASLAGIKPNLVDSSLFVCECKENFSPCGCYRRARDKMLLIECQKKNLKEFPIHLPAFRGYKVQVNLSCNRINFGASPRPKFSTNSRNDVVSLDLSYNEMDSSMFDSVDRALDLRLRFPNLTRLDLTHNKFNIIPSGIIDRYISNANENLTFLLSGNPWSCNCSNLGLFNFLSISWRRIEDFSKMVCLNGVPISQSFDNFCSLKSTKKKYLGNEYSYLSIAMPVLALVTFAICVLVYRSRRTIWAWLYTHQRCFWCMFKEDEDDDNEEQIFDAFISYSHLDEEFVINELIPQMENPAPGLPKYRLCLHYRDWLAGEWIPDQIARSVKSSKRTIVVLSEHFLDSLWGTLEFRTAYQQVLKDIRMRLIIVVKGELPRKDKMDQELQNYLSLNTYLKWNDPLFWERLRYALPHKINPVTPCSRLSRVIIEHCDSLSKEQNNEVRLNHNLLPLPLLTD